MRWGGLLHENHMLDHDLDFRIQPQLSLTSTLDLIEEWRQYLFDVHGLESFILNAAFRQFYTDTNLPYFRVPTDGMYHQFVAVKQGSLVSKEFSTSDIANRTLQKMRGYFGNDLGGFAYKFPEEQLVLGNRADIVVRSFETWEDVWKKMSTDMKMIENYTIVDFWFRPDRPTIQHDPAIKTFFLGHVFPFPFNNETIVDEFHFAYPPDHPLRQIKALCAFQNPTGLFDEDAPGKREDLCGRALDEQRFASFRNCGAAKEH